MPPKTRSGKTATPAAKAKPKAAVGKAREKKVKAKAKEPPARTNSSSTEEDEEGIAAELLVGKPLPSIASSFGSPRKYHPQRTNKAGIAEPIQKLLLTAIEGDLGKGLVTLQNKRRGITTLLETLAVDNEDCLGTATKTKERKAADNKIRNWINLPIQEYEQILEDHAITPYRFLQENSTQELKSKVQKAKVPPKVTAKAKPKVTAKTKPQAKPPAEVNVYRDTNTSLLSESDDESKSKESTARTALSTMPEKYKRNKNKFIGDIYHEYIEVDIDNLHLVPAPFKVYYMEGMVSIKKKGDNKKGYFITVSVDKRDITGAPPFVDPFEPNTVLRPKIEPFGFKSWIYGQDPIMKVPLLDWVDRGNDDILLRSKYDDAVWFTPFLEGFDEQRKGLIDKFGEGEYQSQAKHVVFQFMSSEDPERVFKFDGSDMKLNKTRKGGDLKPYMITHDNILSTVKKVVKAADDDAMDTSLGAAKKKGADLNIVEISKQPIIRLAFCFADDMLGVKRRGIDTFETEEDNELLAMLNDNLDLDDSSPRVARPQNLPVLKSIRSASSNDGTEDWLDDAIKSGKAHLASGFSLLNDMNKGDGKGSKRTHNESSDVGFGSGDQFGSVLPYFPLEIQKEIKGAPSDSEKWRVMNWYLNEYLNQLKPEQQAAIRRESDQLKKCRMMLDFFTANNEW